MTFASFDFFKSSFNAVAFSHWVRADRRAILSLGIELEQLEERATPTVGTSGTALAPLLEAQSNDSAAPAVSILSQNDWGGVARVGQLGGHPGGCCCPVCSMTGGGDAASGPRVERPKNDDAGIHVQGPSNFWAYDANLLDGNNNVLTAIPKGTMVRAAVYFQTTDIPAGANYTLDFNVGGVATQFSVNWAAGSAGVGYWWAYSSGWYAGATTTAVTITVDSTNVVGESNEADNARTFNFTPVTPTPPAKFQWPVGGVFGADFAIGNYCDVDPRSGISADYTGGVYQYDGHTAFDIGVKNFSAMDAGVPIYAAAGGTVVGMADGNFDRQTQWVGNPPANYVQIDHGNGWQTWYWHAKRDSVLVTVGQVVTQGQQIMSMGSSGFSTGVHLHFQTMFRNQPVETMYAPNDYFIAPLPYAGNVPGLMDAGITNQAPANVEYGEAISWMSNFNQSSGQQAYYLQEITGFVAGDVGRWIFTRPNGTQYANFTYTFTGPARQGYYYGWVNLPATPDLGTWTTTFQRNNVTMNVSNFVVTTTGAPEIKLYQGTTYVIDGRTTPLDFGTINELAAGSTQQFTLTNHGKAALTVGAFTLPIGFSLTQAPAASVAAGGNTTFTIQMDSTVPGYKSGWVSFDNGDSDESPFEFRVEGTVANTAAPNIVGAYFDSTSWTPAFRAAAGSATCGYPAQTGAGQLAAMPWSNVNTIAIRFREDVNVVAGNLGIRGINIATYNVINFSYDSVNFVAKWVLSGVIDTDRIILDLDGTSAAAVTDTAGNKLAGSWTEGVSTFPTSGAAAQSFKFRFVIGVGDADRNGLVRNSDLNLVRNNLFVDAGAGGYSIFTDIDGNGLTRNADTNAVRSHLFLDPPAGPGPNRPVRSSGSSSAERPKLAAGRWPTWSTGALGQLPEERRHDIPRSRVGVEFRNNAVDEALSGF